MGNTQSRQRLLARLTAVLWRRVDVSTAILAHGVRKLGGQEDLLALAWVLLEPLA